ncbi:uncharacterized protein IL334_000021 [Kwoniella shivajii]|uniref:Thiol methyltransferase 1 n=1 Tax=Kwoniella shivajii TaxID=564305 RepID=A0ABZ1CNK0_9TREE|nr:hypothetical protein IL334_000021 [Kwoniella shivajii]
MSSIIADDAWEERWKEGRTGWDESASHRSLQSLLESPIADQLDIPKKGRALVPGCGTGYDVHNFARRGLNTTGLDLAPTGVEKAKQWLSSQLFTSGQTDVVCADFFKYKAVEKYDLIYDYTFLCAIPPELRQSWSAQLFKLSSSNATLITLMYPLPPTNNDPPPWPLSTEIYHHLLDESWDLIWSRDVPPEEMRKGGAKGNQKIAVWRKK